MSTVQQMTLRQFIEQEYKKDLKFTYEAPSEPATITVATFNHAGPPLPDHTYMVCTDLHIDGFPCIHSFPLTRVELIKYIRDKTIKVMGFDLEVIGQLSSQ
jgi:hypothetical protein